MTSMLTLRESAVRAGRGAYASLHRPLPNPPDQLRQGPLKQDAFPSPLHNRYVAAWFGYALGWSFLICFVTGLISHLAQHPTSFFDLPARPIWFYRVTQGLHVATGIVCVPLLLAKLWTVYPRFWSWPPVRSIANAVERLSLLILVGGAFFQLITGVANIFKWYFFAFFFTTTHYFTAWVVMGALVVHVGTKITMARDALKHPARYDKLVDDARARTGVVPAAGAVSSGFSRRGLITGVSATAGAITVVTVGQSFSPLGELDLLAPRKPGRGPQHLPVNQTASAAGVTTVIRDPSYRLEIKGTRETRSLSLAELGAMTQYSVMLPITCVEGWSADGHWRGVRFRDLLDLVAAPHHAHIRVESLEKGGLYRSSVVNPSHARDSLTLLALGLNGEELDADHGYPARLISPDRPGVLQTKWVRQIVVLT